MGKEQTCSAVIDGVRAQGRALLETDEILFRHADSAPSARRADSAPSARRTPRLRIALADIRSLKVQGDDLIVRHKGGLASFTLGTAQAKAWAKRIQEPPGLLDKLGVKAGATVVALNLGDEGFLDQLAGRAGTLRRARRGSDADVVLLGAEKVADLAKLAGLERLMCADGGIWIIYPKGRPKDGNDIREADVLAAGRAMGWKDNKTCRVSDTHTGLRFVIPLAKRK